MFAAAWPLGPSSAGRPRCATGPTVAAAYVIPLAPWCFLKGGSAP
jgi:hypothetical protein